MKITIENKQNYEKSFVYNYLPLVIREMTLDSLSNTKVKLIKTQYGIDFKAFLVYVLSNLRVSELNDTYVIEVNKNLYWLGQKVSTLLNLITFGSISIKGYDVVYRVFKKIDDEIDDIYMRWLDGY